MDDIACVESLLDEFKELKLKHLKLRNFIQGSEFRTLQKGEMIRLDEQYVLMRDYLDILSTRIDCL